MMEAQRHTEQVTQRPLTAGGATVGGKKWRPVTSLLLVNWGQGGDSDIPEEMTTKVQRLMTAKGKHGKEGRTRSPRRSIWPGKPVVKHLLQPHRRSALQPALKVRGQSSELKPVTQGSHQDPGSSARVLLATGALMILRVAFYLEEYLCFFGFQN